MKILLIEDDLEIAQFLVKGLKMEGAYVLHAPDSSKAQDFLGRERFDILILDLLLPDFPGEMLLKQLRDRGDATPVIVLSAVDSKDAKIKLFNLGADDYLIKPFSFLELNLRIKAILKRVQPHLSIKLEEICIKNLRLVPRMRTAYQGDQPLRLRLKEYELLSYFMSHPDEVVSRDDLIEKIWDYNSQLFSNTVDSHVSMLRKKLKACSPDEFIQTVHGIGYLFKSK